MLFPRYRNTREQCRKAKALRKNNSDMEYRLWGALSVSARAGDIKFRCQHPLNPYIVDFACVKARLIVEIDGPSHEARQKQDQLRDSELRRRGWMVLRFSNQTVCDNLQGVVETIIRTAYERLSDALPSPLPQAGGELNAMTIRINFIFADGQRRACDGAEGQSLLKLAQANGIGLEGACESSLACATCHLIIDPVWYAKLPPPSVEENGMLDLAPGRARTSRLSCQIRLEPGLHGLLAKVPK